MKTMRLSATAASREFSDLLSRVAAGETIEIDRHGHVVAVVVPPRRGYLGGEDVLALVARLPIPDAGFDRDVKALAEVLKAPGSAWPS